MKKSESIGNLATSLAAAQARMGPAAHDRENPHFRSRYATLASVLEAAGPIHEEGLALVQTATVNRGADGVSVEVETLLAHKSGEWLSETLSMRPTQDTPQAVGSALTYGRRYSAAAILGIASDEDDDGNAASAKPGDKAPAGPKPPVRKPDAPKPPAKPEAPKPPAKPEAPKPEAPKDGAEAPKPEQVNAPAAKTEPAKTEQAQKPTPRPPSSARTAALREVFALSVAAGEKPDEMRRTIGEQMLNLGRPIKGSDEISDDQLENVVACYKIMVAERAEAGNANHQ